MSNADLILLQHKTQEFFNKRKQNVVDVPDISRLASNKKSNDLTPLTNGLEKESKKNSLALLQSMAQHKHKYYYPNGIRRLIPLELSNQLQVARHVQGHDQHKKHLFPNAIDTVIHSCQTLKRDPSSLLRSIYLQEASNLSMTLSTARYPDNLSDLFLLRSRFPSSQSLHKVNPSVSAKSPSSMTAMMSLDNPGTSTTDNIATHKALTGRHPVTVFLPHDEGTLSEYQCFARQQIEFFEADAVDVESNAKGRNKPIVLGQVGIRCRHCAALPPKYRSRGAMYYPTKLNLIYQAAQNMTSIHLRNCCKNAPDAILHELMTLRKCKSGTGGGKLYWNEGAHLHGVREVGDCLRFIQK
jgi:hypothetical protein